MSSADVGTAALVVGLGAALYAIGAGVYAGRTGRREWAASARAAIYALLGLLVLAMVLLDDAVLQSGRRPSKKRIIDQLGYFAVGGTLGKHPARPRARR